MAEIAHDSLSGDWTGAHDERAAIVELDGGVRRAWAESFALDCAQPPGDVPERRWRRFIDHCGAFLDPRNSTGILPATNTATNATTLVNDPISCQ
jgi:hypothetical protein